jgi:hypothetical protein
LSLGFFGGKEYDLLEEYKRPALNILEEYKRVLEGYPMNEEAIVPMLRWYSNHIKNIKNIQDINTRFFYNSKTIVAHSIFLNIDRSIRFIKYPKKVKDENEFAFLIPYIQKLYGWSDKEYEHYRKLINLEDPELHQLLHKKFCLEKSELRKLGMTIEKVTAKFEKIQKTKGFF